VICAVTGTAIAFATWYELHNNNVISRKQDEATLEEKKRQHTASKAQGDAALEEQRRHNDNILEEKRRRTNLKFDTARQQQYLDMLKQLDEQLSSGKITPLDYAHDRNTLINSFNRDKN
jgi:phosphate starvation-inducible protein PhoH